MKEDTFALELLAENILIENIEDKGKVSVTIEGIGIREIEKLVKSIASSSEEIVDEFKKQIFKILSFPLIDSAWHQYVWKNEFEDSKSRLMNISDMDLIKEINDYMAHTKKKSVGILLAYRIELNKRRIDYSSINNWIHVGDWTTVSFYKIGSRKLVMPVQ